MAEETGESQPHNISTVCPNCYGTLVGLHICTSTGLTPAGVAVRPARSDDEMPPVRVVHIIEAHFCSHCGAMCPSCVRTDEGQHFGSNQQQPQGDQP